MTSILKNPRITEKASMLSESNCYTFDVDFNASKNEIAKAVKALYKVTPLHVRTAKIPTKSVASRTKRGVVGKSNRGKKAYVYLKKGDSIKTL